MNLRFSSRLPLAALLLVLVLVMALVGGPHAALDEATIRALAGVRADAPLLTSLAIAITWAGSAYATLGGAALAALWSWVKNRRRSAVWLVATVGGGRLLADGLKLLVDRPRPHFEPWPVPVHSLSFPSGHATNSMLAFTAIAYVLASPPRRTLAVRAAILLSLIIGITRPFLGVHWPSDVIAGWCLGGAVVWLAAPWLAIRRAPAEA